MRKGGVVSEREGVVKEKSRYGTEWKEWRKERERKGKRRYAGGAVSGCSSVQWDEGKRNRR